MEVVNKVYEYRPLVENGAIRLILLEPSSDPTAGLKCSLLHTTLANLDEEVLYHYCALSYVWGNIEDTVPISVDEKELHIGRNLASALRHIRHSTISCYLWADAICINQKDDPEKSVQVAQMGEVYRAARHTILWLGEASMQTDEVLSFIQEAKKQVQAWKELGSPQAAGTETLKSEDEKVPDEEVEASNDGLDIKSLKALLDRPWFTRVWIYQELILSTDPWIQCGKIRVRWEEVSKVIGYYNELVPGKRTSGQQFQSFLSMQKARKDFHALTPQMDRSSMLLQTLAARRGLGVFDSRDMIFAHLGIMENSHLDATLDEWDLLSADYGKNCSTLYFHVAKYLSERTGIFELLSHIETTSDCDQRYPDTPSWVPNWMAKPCRRLQDSISVLRRDYEYHNGPLGDKFSDSSSFHFFHILPKSYKLWISPSTILFLGFRIGTIARLSHLISHESLSLNNFFTQRQKPPGIRSEAYQMICSRWWKMLAPIFQNKEEFESSFWDAVHKFRDGQSHLTDDNLLIHIILHEAGPDNASYPHFLHGRKLAMIPGCGLAVVPGTAMVGDIACFFLERITVPFILRPIADKLAVDFELRSAFKLRRTTKTPQLDHFEYIGECVIENFLFTSLDDRTLIDPSGESYFGGLEAFVIH